MMKLIFLGIIQGLTEFLPISSSGHLVVMKHFLSFDTSGITMEVFLHFGTFLSIIFYFNRKILDYFKLRKIILIIIGTIPAGLLGIFLKDYIEIAFSSVMFVLPMFVITGAYLFFSEKFYKERKKVIGIKEAILIGMAQGIAILPGISRSGATVCTGLLLGLSFTEAFDFSFILSLPALLGAFGLEMRKIEGINNISPYFIGIIFAFLTGLFSLFLFSRFLRVKKLKYFSFYLWFLSALLFPLVHLF